MQEDAILKELYFQYEMEPDAIERIVADEKLPATKNTRGRVRVRLQQLGLLQITKMKKLTECVLALLPSHPLQSMCRPLLLTLSPFFCFQHNQPLDR